MKKLLIIALVVMFAGSAFAYDFNATTSVTKTASYTATASDSEIIVTPASATTITLPSIRSIANNKTYRIKRMDTSATPLNFAVTVTTNSLDTFNTGNTSYFLVSKDAEIIIRADKGKKAWIVDYNTPLTQTFVSVSRPTVTGDNTTFSVAQIIGGFIRKVQTTTGLQATDTLPTATALVAGIPNAKAGMRIDWIYQNAADNTSTIAAGTGGVTSGTMTVVSGSTKRFLIVIDNVSVADNLTISGSTLNPQYTIYSTGTSVH